MLNRGFLVGSSIYSSSIYDDKILKKFEINVNDVFRQMNIQEITGESIDNQIMMTSFKRLNS